MKKIAFLTLIFSALFANAQVQDYPYLVIPSELSGFGEENTQLSNFARILLQKKNYKVFNENTSTWAKEMKLNPCAVLKIDIKKVSENQLELNFKDCNQTTVASYSSSDNDTEKEAIMTNALTKAIHKLPKQTTNIPDYRENERQTVTIVTSTETTASKETTKHIEKETVINNNEATVYTSNYGKELGRINLNDGAILIVTPNQKEIFARFTPSSRKGVYHVTIVNKYKENEQTLGFADETSFSFERKNKENKWELITFSKK